MTEYLRRVRLAQNAERRSAPGGAAARRLDPVRAGGAERPRSLGHRPLGAGHRRAQPRDARRARARLRLRPAARAPPLRSFEAGAAAQERAPLARAPRPALPTGAGQDRPHAVSAKPQPFDPYANLTALERRRVTYVLIGGFARIIQGTEELTHGLDLVPSMRVENLGRLELALDDLAVRLPNGKRPEPELDLPRQAVLELQTDAGELKIVPEPAGTRGGYDDLRRAATREPIGRGLRPRVASIGDLARMLAALGREQDLQPLQQLRTLAELERTLIREIGR